VSFRRILGELAPWFRPSWDLDRGGQELVRFFRDIALSDQDFTGRRTIRLEHLKSLVATGALDRNLRWQS
jgi:hypothetical protein